MKEMLLEPQILLQQQRGPTEHVDPGLMASMVLGIGRQYDAPALHRRPQCITVYDPTVALYPTHFVFLESGLGVALLCRDGAPSRRAGRRDNTDLEPFEIDRNREPSEQLDEEGLEASYLGLQRMAYV
jgi:hypothetical protein